MLDRLYRAMLSGMVRRRTIVLEWYLALQTLQLGLWMLLLLGVASVEHRRVLLGQQLAVFGLALTVHGLATLLVLSHGRPGESRSRRNLDLCRYSTFVTALLWVCLTILAALSRPFGMFWPILLGTAIAALWAYSRLHLRFKEDD